VQVGTRTPDCARSQLILEWVLTPCWRPTLGCPPLCPWGRRSPWQAIAVMLSVIDLLPLRLVAELARLAERQRRRDV
jgi:hypothetical protein